MTDMDRHLDALFKIGAAQLSKLNEGKKCHYELHAMGYTVQEADNGKTGFCEILGIFYSKSLDCNVYRLKDLETEAELCICQFEVTLTDI